MTPVTMLSSYKLVIQRLPRLKKCISDLIGDLTLTYSSSTMYIFTDVSSTMLLVYSGFFYDHDATCCENYLWF